MVILVTFESSWMKVPTPVFLLLHLHDLEYNNIDHTGVEIRTLSLSVSSLISIFGLTSVQKIVLNQYKLSILALFTFKFLNFQFLIFLGYSEWKWVKMGPICIFWK